MDKQPKYAIINEYDAPQKRMVCQYVEGVGYCYMSKLILGDERLSQHDGMTPDSPTPMEDFGFEIEEREYQVDFVQTGFSTATYRDGAPRLWQDARTKFSLPKIQEKSC